MALSLCWQRLMNGKQGGSHRGHVIGSSHEPERLRAFLEDLIWEIRDEVPLNSIIFP